MRRLLLAAAAGVAAALGLAPGSAPAALVFTDTTFNGEPAVIDPVSGLGWVTPNIASGDDILAIAGLCPGGTCTGPLTGLTWASSAQVVQFWDDIGVPLNPALTNSYTQLCAFGPCVLLPLIDALGPTGHDLAGNPYLGGISNNTPNPVLGPNTPYMFQLEAGIFGPFSESAFTNPASGNGLAETDPMGGWFFFTPSSVTVPEPASLALLGAGLIALAAIRRRWKKA